MLNCVSNNKLYILNKRQFAMAVKHYANKFSKEANLGAKKSAFLYSFYILIGLIIYIGLMANVGAEEARIFSVSNVKVDVTSNSSADARTKAISDGQLRAFQILLRRLVKSDELARLPSLTSEEVEQYVRDFSVNNEKNSPIRYLANLTFRFKAPKIRLLLRDLEVEFAETVRKPILILPIYDLAAAKSLWETPNPWRKAWGDLGPHVGLVPFNLPAGDLKDVGIIGAEQAATGDQPRIRAIGDHYNVETVMVAHALLTSGPSGEAAISVEVVSYGSEGRSESIEEQFLLKDTETIYDLLKRAATSTRNKIEDLWKEDNLIKFEQGSVLATAVPIASLTDWVEVRSRLAKIAIIERIDLVLISRNEALINVFYLGGDQQLSLALAQADMMLEQEEGSWTLRFRQKNKIKSKIKGQVTR